jgi:hypothetical protein
MCVYEHRNSDFTMKSEDDKLVWHISKKLRGGGKEFLQAFNQIGICMCFESLELEFF